MNDFTLILTEAAEEFLKKKVDSNKAIQLRIKPSGCSGYSYVLNITEKSKGNVVLRSIPFDILEQDKPFLNNTVIDIQKDNLNTKIIFNNPQAYNYCGCGESFSIRR